MEKQKADEIFGSLDPNSKKVINGIVEVLDALFMKDLSMFIMLLKEENISITTETLDIFKKGYQAGALAIMMERHKNSKDSVIWETILN